MSAAAVGNIAKTEVTLRSAQVGISTSSIAAIEVTQVTQGLTGAPGGTQPGTGDANYLHLQNTASAEWTINHNLGKYPSVTVVDSANDEVEGNINHISVNQLIVTFSAAFAGRAFIN